MTALPTPLAVQRLQFPAQPDWTWLRWHWQRLPGLHEAMRLREIATREKDQLACLATPYRYSEGGPVLGADCAGAWMQDLAAAEIMSISPAFLAGWSGLKAAHVAPSVRVSGCVVVPPAVGWQEAPDVWQAVCLALVAVKPVYLLEGCA
ncbi:hypothetical protein [Pseudophaeobacter sp.]|jgi:hypothetical protein|uniref:hypothetical protein n=1 Tax=Pseudophaeobacter sp. TaxID=1971739 RepID=UPI0032D99440